MLRQLMITLIVLFAAGSVWAQGMQSVASPSEPHGMVISSVDMPADSIFAVDIKNIDGKEIPPFPSGVWLKPGVRTIKGFGVVEGNYTVGRVRGTYDRVGRAQPLEIDVQEGMAYYVGLEAKGPPESWKLVVWKTEPLQ